MSPSSIVHYQDIQNDDVRHYPGSEELMSIGSSFGSHFGLKRLGIHHELVPPGRRTSWPHAESAEEEFVYVIEGTPQVWLDGEVHDLAPGDGVGFPAGTGLAHTFLNNTDRDVRLLVVGEKSKDENRIVYPMHPARNVEMKAKGYLWEDQPERELGSHDGLPDAQRNA
ncbi:MAG: cupin domain-containing protein [Gammaproteobacteria bacterium]|jgi:uncharacterized cupin superfamily protein|nr:cupin domain-containing protein [Gammaproteobacteria bacterium]MBT4491929.1 cupin domain-containing protein [Gammaproteobacteria bacterium]MBT7370475.1 cupin domain-containing protein [Gammaproteobacteria bacterium]